MDVQVQEQLTEGVSQNKLLCHETTEAEGHNSEVVHDGAVIRKQAYFICLNGFLSGEKVFS